MFEFGFFILIPVIPGFAGDREAMDRTLLEAIAFMIEHRPFYQYIGDSFRPQQRRLTPEFFSSVVMY